LSELKLLLARTIMAHPDAPSNVECAHELFLEAVKLAKSHVKRTVTVPWVPARLTSAVIREVCGQLADVLINELKSGEMDYE
jgi:hypothetical protein